MDRIRRGTGRTRAPVVVVSILCIAGLLVNIPALARANPNPTSGTVPPAVLAPYEVTWNGVDVSTAGSASSALGVDLTQSANLIYTWNLSAPATADISDARVQMFYFGFAVATRDQVLTSPTPTASGNIPLSWVPLSVAYLLEGVYKLTASFIAANGTTMWSESFYVRDSAPLGVLAILPIVLLLIMVYEVYGLLRSGRYAALGAKLAGSKPPKAPPPEPATSSTPPSTPPAAEEGTSDTNASPPSGGGA